MEDTLISLLKTEYKLPVIRQGSLGADDAYPDSFFTFWENSSYDASHYDNAAIGCVHSYDVNFYSNNPETTYTTSRSAIALLKANGFIVSGTGYDVASDEDTHTGRGFQALYAEYLNSNEED